MPSQHERRAGTRPRGERGRPVSGSDAKRPRIPVRKRWGQHFLANPETARRIVEAARVGAEDSVLEVGPGDGALTRFLAERARAVAAVEIDPLRAEALAAELAGDTRVHVFAGDVLSRPLAAWLAAAGVSGEALLVANLPYNAATPILFAALEARGVIRRIVATVQREVARRFVSRPGDEGYGYLSVRAAALSTGRILFDLPPGAFRPPPKVVSSVLELTPRAESPEPDLVRRALTLASLGFNARRKTLPNALSSAAPRGDWEPALAALGKSPKARAEELSLDDFLALARGWRR
jgi:16S rRNA (adenine1518-N6/adenine1519-N6)-dimethyltransferase